MAGVLPSLPSSGGQAPAEHAQEGMNMATRRTKREPGLYVATTTGVVRIGDKLVRYTRGKTIVDQSDPLVRLLPDRFRLLDISSPEVVAL